MNLFGLFSRRDSAPVARDRLKILLEHERAFGGDSDLLNKLRAEILEVIQRHMPVEQNKVSVKLDRGEQVSTLEIGVEMPFQAGAGVRRAA